MGQILLVLWTSFSAEKL